MAWNIGANDVANAMGTSVGSRALTYRQAIVVAAIFEFAGAFLVGSHVTNTIQSKILEVDHFLNYDEGSIDLALGMMASLISAGIWLNFATWKGWPSSTTHSILGSLFGVGLLTGGFGIIHWDTMGNIALSWIISPVVGGLVAYVMFMIILRGIIRQKDPRKAMLRIVPPILFIFFTIITLSLFYKGLKHLHIDWEQNAVMILNTFGIQTGEISEMKFNPGNVLTLMISIGIGLVTAIAGRLILPGAISKNKLGHSRRSVEKVFTVLQIMTACYMAFAHGANDVANAIGPLSAVVTILDPMKGLAVLQDEGVPIWVLLLGGTGIVAGLAMWGYKVMQTVGHNITAISPTRGFAAEFGAATTVLVCSRMGLPVSTTHVLVGAVVGIGLLRGLSSINLKVLQQVFSSWIITVPFSAVLAAGLWWVFKMIWLSAQ